MLEDYVFVDENYQVIERRGLRDDEAAEKIAYDMARRLNKTVIVLHEVCSIGPVED